MAKRKRQQGGRNTQQARQQKDASLQVVDALGDDVLQQLKQAKSQLAKAAEKEAEAEKERRRREREEREKNKSFEELLEEYGDQSGKFS